MGGLCDDGDRAARDCIEDEARAVHVDAGNRDEERAGDHLARVGSDVRDFNVACVLDLVRGERAEEGGEVHSGLALSSVLERPSVSSCRISLINLAGA